MIYNFDEIISRENTCSVKYDMRKSVFKTNDVIPMWVADMDFATPKFIVDAVKRRAENPIYGYHFRDKRYFESIISWMRRRHGWEVKPEWISFSPGIVCGLNMAVEALTNKGDEIMIQTPVYHPFHQAVTEHDRKLVTCPLTRINNSYMFDFELFEKQAATAKMFILCNPHNPLGKCWTHDELESMGEICARNEVIVISDEIHSDMMLHGQRHLPFALVNEKNAQNSITFNAASKTFNIAGLATSNVIIPNDDLRNRFTKYVNSLSVDMGNIFGTEAAMAAYTYGDEWLEQCMNYVSANIDYAACFLAENLPDVHFVKPDASYLMWLDFSAYGSDEEIWNRLINDAHLGLNRGIEFGKEGECHFRINMACPRSTVVKAMHNLKEAFA